MGVADLMRELRLLKGQQGYRFCMAWVIALTHILARPTLILLFLLAAPGVNEDTAIGKAMSAWVPMLIRALNRYLQFV
jgi:hypothetical protein